MSALELALSAFTAAELAAAVGLPAEVDLDDLAPFLTIDPDDVGRGQAGTPSTGRSWVAAEAPVYDGGVRLWRPKAARRCGPPIAASTVVTIVCSTAASDSRPLCSSALAVWTIARITARCHDTGTSLRKTPSS